MLPVHVLPDGLTDGCRSGSPVGDASHAGVPPAPARALARDGLCRSDQRGDPDRLGAGCGQRGTGRR